MVQETAMLIGYFCPTRSLETGASLAFIPEIVSREFDHFQSLRLGAGIQRAAS